MKERKKGTCVFWGGCILLWRPCMAQKAVLASLHARLCPTSSLHCSCGYYFDYFWLQVSWLTSFCDARSDPSSACRKAWLATAALWFRTLPPCTRNGDGGKLPKSCCSSVAYRLERPLKLCFFLRAMFWVLLKAIWWVRINFLLWKRSDLRKNRTWNL